MHEAVMAIRTSREYALEQKEAIVKKYGPLEMWSTEDEADHNYWEGQCDALERALIVIDNKVMVQQLWADGYTSALANAREHGYVTVEQYDDLYEEVLNLG